MPRNKKLIDKKFLIVIRGNSGLYSPTAKTIKSELGIEITRKAIRAKALNFLDESRFQYRKIY